MGSTARRNGVPAWRLAWHGTAAHDLTPDALLPARQTWHQLAADRLGAGPLAVGVPAGAVWQAASSGLEFLCGWRSKRPGCRPRCGPVTWAVQWFHEHGWEPGSFSIRIPRPTALMGILPVRRHRYGQRPQPHHSVEAGSADAGEPQETCG